jgi:antitoxin CcdA
MNTKKAVNLNLDQVLLAKARAEGLNLSAELEQTVRMKIASIEAERWKRENAEAIRESNEELERNGLWNEDYRLW